MSNIHNWSRAYANGQKKKTNKTLDYSSTIKKIQFIDIRNSRRVQVYGVADVRTGTWAERADQCVVSSYLKIPKAINHLAHRERFPNGTRLLMVIDGELRISVGD